MAEFEIARQLAELLQVGETIMIYVNDYFLYMEATIIKVDDFSITVENELIILPILKKHLYLRNGLLTYEGRNINIEN